VKEEAMTVQYDAIVVGARCAGAPTAMLLARAGHRVLLVDRATFPSDTLSTHVIHAAGVAALRRWGVLDAVLATGCPPVDVYSYDFGPFALRGTPRPCDGSSAAYAPRRYLLDAILVAAAAAAGAEVREDFSVSDLLVDDGGVVGVRGHGADGRAVTERARVVVGADGRNSHVAKQAGASAYAERPRQQYSYYTYWQDLPVDSFATWIRPGRGWAAVPTNDGLTLVVLGWPYAEATAYKTDVEGNYLATLELAPEFAERVRAATRVAPFAGGAVPNFLRTPYGRGWALVGDAGLTMDPITAQGMTDAFTDAERSATALDRVFRGDASFEQAMAAAHRERDAQVLPRYDFTTALASLAPPPPEHAQLLFAAQGDQDAMDGFASVVAGTLLPAEFFSGAAARV
jgi:2-polyprenyl-6-methoxyphenol hydroxylase-like FAD-dependent oxidoreductase